MNAALRAKMLLALGVVLVFGFATLSVRQLNAKAGGRWSARDMWVYLHDTVTGRRLTCANGLRQLALIEAEFDSAADQTAREPDDVFRFPDDRAGPILSQTLPPSEKLPAPSGRDAPAPRSLPPPDHLDKPSLPLPPSQVDMPRLPAGKTPSLRPSSLPEELPLLGNKADPLPPEVQHLYAGDRIRVPSVDVNKPIPLPILAQPVSTRAPLDEVTSDASLAAALAAIPPGRTTPAPFLKQNLPDPFENRLKPPVIPEVEVAPLHTGSRPLR
jgi:hypothetical protein